MKTRTRPVPAWKKLMGAAIARFVRLARSPTSTDPLALVARIEVLEDVVQWLLRTHPDGSHMHRRATREDK